MNRDTALQAFERITSASVEIGRLAALFRERIDDEGSKQMILGCGRVLASMNDELLARIFAAYPDLEDESRRRAHAALAKPENSN